MSYINEIEFDFEIGDSYEMSPIEMTYLVGKVMALGGGVYIDGNIVTITSMPGKEFKPEPKPEPKVTWFAPETPPVETTPEVTPAPEPVAEAPQAVETEEAPVEVDEAPIKRARKTAAKTEEPAVSDEPVPAPVEE